ncbi:hypothetical protein GCM10023156_09360 [Novipirellula rosea]|uniref:Secreted protein n=1 Tax=Novipirellula rosea TaxID=1031540 RepID=A0ABP8MDN2_9BACT
MPTLMLPETSMHTVMWVATRSCSGTRSTWGRAINTTATASITAGNNSTPRSNPANHGREACVWWSKGIRNPVPRRRTDQKPSARGNTNSNNHWG